MSTIYEVITPEMTAVRWRETSEDRPPYLFEAFLPDTKQDGVEIEYFKGKQPKVRVLDLSAYDVPALPISPEAFEKISTEMPFFKNKMAINEKLRQELLKVLATGNQAYIDAVLNKIFNFNKILLDDARVTREYMRAMLLTTGIIAFQSNGQKVSYDFEVPSTNKVTANWSNTETSDPISDITSYQDMVENATGFRPTNLVLNRNSFVKLKNSKSIRNSILALTSVLGGSVTVNDTKVKQFILDETGVTIYVYDKGYYDKDTKKFTKFVPDNVFSFFPDGVLGNTVFGTTPEEADLQSGTEAQVEIVDTGVAITTWKEVDPVRVDTKVSMVCVPTLEMSDALVIGSIA